MKIKREFLICTAIFVLMASLPLFAIGHGRFVYLRGFSNQKRKYIFGLMPGMEKKRELKS